MSRTGNHPQVEGAADLATRLAAAEKALSARDKTIRVLMQRVQARQANKRSALALLGQNADLQEVVARKTLELEERTVQLAGSLSLLNATLESTADGILVADGRGGAISFNEKFLEMWHIPREVSDRKSEQEMLEIARAQLKQPEQFMAGVKSLYSGLEKESFDVLEFQDGKIFERYSKPQRIGKEIVGRVWSFRDVTERKKAEHQLGASLKELRGKTAFLEALVNSSLEGILVVNDQGKTAVQNQQFNRLMKIPREIAEDVDDARRLQYVTDSTKNPEKFHEKVLHLYSHRDETSRDEVEFKDGRVMDRYSSPVLDENGNYYGRIWAFRDITDQKRMQREVEETQRQLVLASRQAGMAEVATSVLHNVGNVLNSVNVSTAAILDQVKKSRFANVARVAGLLEEHAGDLAQFITVDPTGRETPAYLRRLGNYLEREQQTLLKEIELIQRHVEHIKEIVAMQQGYAKCFGIVEKVQVPDMVEDALRINAGALARHEVQVVRDYNLTISEIAVEKHKVLQILVNLIRNAKDACHEGSCREKLLTIRLTNSGDRVRIEVVDNGVGILKENLKRIFSFGFTTRKGGHGFGLHSAALAAAEMGASLAAHSEGPQMGATFTLELPLQPPKASL
jgi:PAS domain S-box-containing protein